MPKFIMIQSPVQKITEAAERNLGGTFDPKTGDGVNKADGYFVSVAGGTFSTYFSDQVVRDFLNETDMDGYFLGVWHNDGVWFMDRSVWVDNLDSALAMADLHDQDAVWDCKNDTEIYAR